ncbi:hypothetical protein EVJ58_g2831 [Rhodofomes roseus]|uniref:AAA+ ATPase domain-containing protein n=1 Tax=Rhodofomes roseus TaxID=34475 RepID=A0A4Y9YQP6_9APHY|nr:hypothetical protein EVJ58_g2831 [Rhodofomes roseus]
MNETSPNGMDDTNPEVGHGNPRPQGERKPRAQIARYDMFFNQRTFKSDLRKTHKPVAKKMKAIIVVKRLIDSRGQLSDTVIEINQEALRRVLLHINEGVMGLELTARKPTVKSQVFFFSYKQLEALRYDLQVVDSPDACETLEGVEAALRFIEEDLRETIYNFDTLEKQQQITYEYLWALFRPNTHVYAYHRETGQYQVALAKALHYRETKQGHFVDIECDIIVHDDLAFGLSELTLRIPRFLGTRSILGLPVYPFAYHPTQDAYFQFAVRRGRRYADLRLHFCQHEGTASVHPDNSDESDEDKGPPTNTLQVNERVMVDVESFFEFQPRSNFIQRVHHALDPRTLTESDFLICTPVLLGFCFTTKAWGAFAIDRFTDVRWSEEPFNGLVLGAKQKTLIHSLVREHSSKPTEFDDVVAGKGRGLVGLLCGNPGCGKTLTAEAVAETTRKPLYTVSAGELGTSPGYTDGRLRRILRLGERWNAVVLLDEADVFLQERDKADVSRNALVSIFLRQVEYHPGILILTTNLLDNIDPAFESRIHFCVRYPDLDFASRKAVWRTFLSKAGISEGDISERDFIRLAQVPLNGRQIKNVVGTAKSIASAERQPQGLSKPEGVGQMSETPKLALRHVRIVLDVMQDWRVAKSDRAPVTIGIVLVAAGIICAFIGIQALRARQIIDFFV